MKKTIMLEFKKEYYKHPLYFYLKDNGNTFSLYYSVCNNISEGRKKDEKLEFDKKDFNKITSKIKKIIKDKKVKKNSDVKKEFKVKDEVSEFIDDDGTLSTSKVPIINNRLSPKRTLDQTVVSVMQTNNPVTRGYRVYYGESKNNDGQIIRELSPSDSDKLGNIPKTKSKLRSLVDNSDLDEDSKNMLDKFISNVSSTDLPFELFKLKNKSKITVNGKVYKFDDSVSSFVKKIIEKEDITEIDYSDAFGFDETKDLDGKKTFNYLKKKMGMDDEEASKRTKEFGKDPTGKKTKNAPKKIKNDPNFIDRMTLAEIERQKMMKMVEDILSKKKDDGEIQKKDNKLSKILMKNLQSIKKIAEKEGININQLVKILKTSE